MFNPRSLRSAVIVATAAMLTAGGVWATENKRDESKPQSGAGQSKESSVTIAEDSAVSQAQSLGNVHRAKRADVGDGITMEFVRIPAGSFYMRPAHHVQFIKPFYMGKYEVTQAQWKAVMGTTVSQQHKKANSFWHLKGVGPEHPIYYVSWEEAMEFCKRLGTNFRLPSESEREYACRAGSKTRFHYGDDPDYSQLDLYAWYYDNSKGSTHPVGQKKPNVWGLYDIHGNVSEWCSDRYVLGSYLGHYRRGSNWFLKPTERLFLEFKFDGGRSDLIGFRVVFTGNLDNGKKVLEIALPKGTAEFNIAQEKKTEIKPVIRMAITGVIRDDAGTPIDGVKMKILPGGDWLFREYPEGRFEVHKFSKSSEVSIRKYHFLARHMQRNLVAFMELNEDVNNLDVRLEQGAILAGKVVDPYDNGIQNAQFHMLLQAFDWREPLSPVIVEPNMEGKFEIRALPLGHKYSVLAGATGYRINKFEFQTRETPGNRIEKGHIVLDRGQFSVSGVVVDKKGKPVANAVVYCTGENQLGISSRTDAKGEFTIDGIFEGPVEINAWIRGDSPRDVSYGHKRSYSGATNVKIVLRYSHTYGPPERTQ